MKAQVVICLIAIACILSPPQQCYSQSQNSPLACNESVLLVTEKNLGKLSEPQMKNFLLTFDESCKNNVEFSEWSNELLDLVISKQPQMFIATLHSARGVKLQVILKELESPMSDEFNVDSTIAAIKTVKGYRTTVDSVLARLNVAKSKE